MKQSEVLFGLVRIPLDALSVLCALILSYNLRLQNIDLVPRVQLLDSAHTLPNFSEYVSTFVWPGVIAFICIAAVIGLYALRITRSAWNEAGRILLASIVWIVVVMAWYFLVRKQLFYSRILLLHSTTFIILFVAITRLTVVLLQRACLTCDIGVRAVLSVGTQPIVMSVQKMLEEDLRYRYLGHADDLTGLKRRAAKRHIDLVLQTDPHPRSDETIALIDYCRAHHIGYGFLPPVLADVPHQLRIEHLGLMPLIRFQPTPLDGWGRVLKRFFDIVFSILGIIILSPVFLILSIAILIDDGWPIFYVSKRIGDEGRRKISVLKFRSMVRNADDIKQTLTQKNQRKDGPLFKMKNDPRITRTGKLLRRFDLDELPQLFNVLMGQMSLVGPRPHLPEEVDLYTDKQRRVFAVRPGITGLAQVSGRSDLSFADEVHLDLQYIEEWSLFMDLWIIWRTIAVVLKGHGAD